MTVASALADRYAMWHALLCEDYGYEETEPVRPPSSAYELALRAVRPAWPPVQAVVFDVRETWLPGADPELGLTLHGCFLATSAWHAQVLAGAGAEGAERLDVDRSKPPELWVHRHPLGQPNDIRVPAAPLKHPDAWVLHIEELVATHYGYLRD
jgi:hypothetical protein